MKLIFIILQILLLTSCQANPKKAEKEQAPQVMDDIRDIGVISLL